MYFPAENGILNLNVYLLVSQREDSQNHDSQRSKFKIQVGEQGGCRSGVLWPAPRREYKPGHFSNGHQLHLNYRHGSYQADRP